MKRFTVKDFIKYNGPCFSCDNGVSFRIGAQDNRPSALTDIETIRPSFKPDHFSIDLQIQYSRSLQLWIFFKTNKIVASDLGELKKYLIDHNLYLKTYCDRCYTTIETNKLEFNLDELYIKPVSLSREILNVTSDNYIYRVETYYDPEETHVIATSLAKPAIKPPAQLTLPLLPLYKFKTKERFINKIKTYLTFS